MAMRKCARRSVVVYNVVAAATTRGRCDGPTAPCHRYQVVDAKCNQRQDNEQDDDDDGDDVVLLHRGVCVECARPRLVDGAQPELKVSVGVEEECGARQPSCDLGSRLFRRSRRAGMMRGMLQSCR